MRRSILFMPVLMAAFPMASAHAAPTHSHAAAGEPSPIKALPFAAAAGASDLYEIESSRLAMASAQRADVRNFAQMMIDHHTKTTRTLTEAAGKAGLTPPPPAMTPKQAEMIAQLKAAPAANFDAAYLRQQTDAHREALALHQTYASKGDAPALRSAASSAVPIVQQHYDRVRELARETG